MFTNYLDKDGRVRIMASEIPAAELLERGRKTWPGGRVEVFESYEEALEAAGQGNFLKNDN